MIRLLLTFFAVFACVVWANATVQDLILDLERADEDLGQCQIDLVALARGKTAAESERATALWRVDEERKLASLSHAEAGARAHELLKAGDLIAHLRRQNETLASEVASLKRLAESPPAKRVAAVERPAAARVAKGRRTAQVSRLPPLRHEWPSLPW